MADIGCDAVGVAIAQACWNTIGVSGNRSCPNLDAVVHCRNCPRFAAVAKRLFDRNAPADYLQEWTRELASEEAAQAQDTISAVVFRLAGEWLALKTGVLVEVVKPRTVHRVPHRSDPLFLGLVNIRGELQLCISLHELLGIPLSPELPSVRLSSLTETRQAGKPDVPGAGKPDAPAAKARLLVAEHRQNRWVFPADEVAGVCRTPAGAPQNLPATVERSARRYARAVFVHQGNRVGLLDEDRVFEALEKGMR